jgi:RNA polymerase sigma factor for flagellar operon FliA
VRDRLVTEHLALVRTIARRLRRTVGRAMDFEDMVAYGHQGLIEAAERFDSGRSITFGTFAYYRIRGAMFDGVRTMGRYSRAGYARFRGHERAHAYLDTMAAETPGPEGKDGLAGLADTLGALVAVHLTSLEAAADVADQSRPAADDAFALGQLGRRVREAVGRLPEKEGRLMALYYFEDRNLEDAGRALGLSKSWACRLHARAVDQLREALAPGH